MAAPPPAATPPAPAMMLGAGSNGEQLDSALHMLLPGTQAHAWLLAPPTWQGPQEPCLQVPPGAHAHPLALAPGTWQVQHEQPRFMQQGPPALTPSMEYIIMRHASPVPSANILALYSQAGASGSSSTSTSATSNVLPYPSGVTAAQRSQLQLYDPSCECVCVGGGEGGVGCQALTFLLVLSTQCQTPVV